MKRPTCLSRPAWTYALACALRSLLRAVLRNFWGRHVVYPALAAYVARRAGVLGVPLDVERVAAIPRGPNGKFEFIVVDG